MPDQVLSLLRARYASRALSPEPLSPETIALLIEAARLTPSCFNKQPWRFLFLTSADALAKGRQVVAAGNRVWAERAPLLVIAHATRKDDCELPDGRAYYQFDLGMAVMNLMLIATEHGLTARPMAGYDPHKARELFGLKEGEEPLVLLAIGKPSTDESHLPDHYKGAGAKPRERKPASEIARIL